MDESKAPASLPVEHEASNEEVPAEEQEEAQAEPAETLEPTPAQEEEAACNRVSDNDKTERTLLADPARSQLNVRSD